MTPESRALLKLIARAPKGRVSYALVRRDSAMAFAQPLLDAGFIRERRLGYDEGFQVEPKGREFLEGESA